MSAFVVDFKTINRIVTYFNSCCDCITTHPFKVLGYDPSQFADLERLAGDLYLLNCEAVDQRYGKGTGDPDWAFAFRFEPCDDPAAIYKHAKCLLYQCSEGDVPERHLYKKLQEFADALAHRIIEQMPAYGAAQWG